MVWVAGGGEDGRYGEVKMGGMGRWCGWQGEGEDGRYGEVVWVAGGGAWEVWGGGVGGRGGEDRWCGWQGEEKITN